MRTPLLVATTLVLGFALGWVSRPTAQSASPRTSSTAPSPTGAPVETKPATPAGTEPAAGAPRANRNDAFRNRAETVRSFRQAGAAIILTVMNRDAFSPAFGKILELTPDEIARLNQLVADTKSELDTVRAAHATSRTSEDGKTFIVEVPAADVTTSRTAYDRLLGALKSTLGPERYELFNELGGEGFERSFDQFGLDNVRYELSLQPAAFSGDTTPYYEYKRHFVDATGTGKGWGAAC